MSGRALAERLARFDAYMLANTTTHAACSRGGCACDGAVFFAGVAYARQGDA